MYGIKTDGKTAPSKNIRGGGAYTGERNTRNTKKVADKGEKRRRGRNVEIFATY